MNEFLHRTDTLGSSKVVICGKQKTHWLEFQLLDERGEPLVNIPYRAENDATRAACAPVYTGVSDAQGVIRLEGLHPIRISLKLSADPLLSNCRQGACMLKDPSLHGLELATLHRCMGLSVQGFHRLKTRRRRQGMVTTTCVLGNCAINCPTSTRR